MAHDLGISGNVFVARPRDVFSSHLGISSSNPDDKTNQHKDTEEIQKLGEVTKIVSEWRWVEVKRGQWIFIYKLELVSFSPHKFPVAHRVTQVTKLLISYKDQ